MDKMEEMYSKIDYIISAYHDYLEDNSCLSKYFSKIETITTIEKIFKENEGIEAIKKATLYYCNIK